MTITHGMGGRLRRQSGIPKAFDLIPELQGRGRHGRQCTRCTKYTPEDSYSVFTRFILLLQGIDLNSFME